MTVKGGTTPACAACKYQRRKCSPNCPLAPYFPADQPEKFQNVHRLFGVSHVTKILNNKEIVDTKDKKDEAMSSICYEADMRKNFPVRGCVEVILRLQQQISRAYAELLFIRRLLAALQQHQPADLGVGLQFLLNQSGEESSGDHVAGEPVATMLDLEVQMEALGMNRNCRMSSNSTLTDRETHHFNTDESSAFDDTMHSYFARYKIEALLESSMSSSVENGHQSRMGDGSAVENDGSAVERGAQSEPQHHSIIR